MNVSKLRGVLAERGVSQEKAAKAIGISSRTFYKKMKAGVFGTDEAQRLVDYLHIEEPSAIFFDRK